MNIKMVLAISLLASLTACTGEQEPETVAQAEPGGIAMARSDDNLHPVIGLWPVGLADDLEAALTDGVRKVLRWTDRHGTLPVDFDFVALGGQAIDPFFNANTPEELEQARVLLETD